MRYERTRKISSFVVAKNLRARTKRYDLDFAAHLQRIFSCPKFDWMWRNNSAPNFAETHFPAFRFPPNESRMTVPAQVSSHSSASSREFSNTRPAKRIRIEAAPEDTTSQLGTFVRRHPLGVRPSGNVFTSKTDLKNACGSLAVLPDELLVQLLETLQVSDLLRLGSTCRALYAFTSNEELWRALFVE